MTVPRERLLTEGSAVDVWCPSIRDWSAGFRIERIDRGAAFVRRVSDDQVLPAAFPLDRVRPATPALRASSRRSA